MASLIDELNAQFQAHLYAGGTLETYLAPGLVKEIAGLRTALAYAIARAEALQEDKDYE